MKKHVLILGGLLAAFAAFAKIPAPVLSDEAKAKAAETAAKTAWNGKVDAFQLCRAQEKVAARTAKMNKAAGKDVKAPAETPACADPGAFVYVPAPPAPAAVAAPVVAAAPAAAMAPAKPAAPAKP